MEGRSPLRAAYGSGWVGTPDGIDVAIALYRRRHLQAIANDGCGGIDERCVH